MPQWTTNVSNIPPTQVKTRGSSCPASTKSSNDASRPAQHISTGTVASCWLGRYTGPQTTVLGLLPLMEVEMRTPTPEPTRQCDDNDDIASFSCQQTATIDVQKHVTLAVTLPRGRAAVLMEHHALGLEELSEDHIVGSFKVACSLDVEHTSVQAAQRPKCSTHRGEVRKQGLGRPASVRLH